MQDWRGIWSRELIETPPADEMVATYLGYKPPDERRAGDGADDDEIWECPFPETTE